MTLHIQPDGEMEKLLTSPALAFLNANQWHLNAIVEADFIQGHYEIESCAELFENKLCRTNFLP